MLFFLAGENLTSAYSRMTLPLFSTIPTPLFVTAANCGQSGRLNAIFGIAQVEPSIL